MQRRTFIQTVGFGAVGLYANGIFPISNDVRSLGIQLYSVRDAVAVNLEATLEKLAALDYKELEIYGYDGQFFGKSRREFQNILDNTGFKVISSHHTTGIGVTTKGTIAKGWEDAIENMHAIGAKYMVCAYLFENERSSEVYQSLPKLFERAGALTQKANIQFAYHNHDFEFEPFGDTLLYDFLLQQTASELVQMEMDLYWISKAGNDPLVYFEKYPGRFPLWHVKDMESGTKDFTEVGNGTINFDRIFAAKSQAGLHHWFVEQDVSKGNIFESLQKSSKYLQTKNY